MAEYAPAALIYFGREIAKLGGALSGIVGDSAHTYGYHRARNVLPPSDYSVTLPLDKLGDGNAASAVDWTLPDHLMRLYTTRLKNSALNPNDRRLDVLREFGGTLDSNSVYAIQHSGPGAAWTRTNFDSSHLWHIHFSFFRKHSNDQAAADAVLSVLRGEASGAVPDTEGFFVVPFIGD